MHRARSPSRRSPRTGRVRRALPALYFALLSIGLLVAQAARLGHLLLVSHVACEHGALVHGAHEHAADEALSAAAVSDQRDHADHARSAPAAPHGGHEHCDLSAVNAPACAVRAACVVPTLLDGELLPWSVRPRPDAPAIDILSLAPKSSPPA